MKLKLSAKKDISALILAAEYQIDYLSSRERNKYATPSMDGIYTAKRDEAISYLASDPLPNDLSEYPYLAAEIGITAPSAYQLAQLWINLSDLWTKVIAPMIERERQRAKNAVRVATNPSEVDAAVASLNFSLSP